MSEPAADVISTQTWRAVGDGPDGGWSDQSITVDSGPLTRVPGRPVPPGPAPNRPAPNGPAPNRPAPNRPARHGPALDSPALDSSALNSSARNSRPEIDDDTVQVRAVTGPAAPTANRLASSTVTRPRAPGRGQGTRGRARPRSQRGRARMWLAGGLAAAVLAGTTAYFVLFHHGHSASPPTSPQAATLKPKSTSNPGPPASLGTWGYIGSRVTDPVPLTLGELFPPKFSLAGLTYTMTVDKSRVHCNLAVAGSQLQSAVGNGCSQAMVASYLSSQQVMGTIGVLNLATAASAESAGKATGPSEFVAQLPGPAGPTKSLGNGTGIEAAEVKGHYLILVWAELTSLKAPATPVQKTDVQSFINVLIQQTANVSLASREVTGKPPT